MFEERRVGGIASRGQLRMSFLRWAVFTVPLILLLGFASGRAVPSGSENGWYMALQKPALTPPGIVFPIAWTSLYILIGFAVALILHARGGKGRGLALALFAALGLGIALPFLALAFLPALRRRMPRPGGWMNTFRRWMALPMGLTALALAWLATRVAGPLFACVAIALAALLILLLAYAGKRQRQGVSVMRATGFGLGAIVVASAVLLPLSERAPSRETTGLIATKPFSEAALAEARATGKPVLAWFTADWCLTCKVNEEVAIERESTRAAFEKAGVIVLKGDWTRRDPAITRYLTAQGAAGVPLYVWYPGKNGAPEQLPQVLGPSTLAEKACPKGACS